MQIVCLVAGDGMEKKNVNVNKWRFWKMRLRKNTKDRGWFKTTEKNFINCCLLKQTAVSVTNTPSLFPLGMLFVFEAFIPVWLNITLEYFIFRDFSSTESYTILSKKHTVWYIYLCLLFSSGFYFLYSWYFVTRKRFTKIKPQEGNFTG